jgi:hypothetical protein
MLLFCFTLKIDFNFQNVSGAPNFLSFQASATMDEVIYSAPLRPWVKSSIVPAARSGFSVPILATMDEVIHSAPWRPGMKSSLVPVALLQKDWNTSLSQIGIPVYSAALILIYSSVFKCFQLAY